MKINYDMLGRLLIHPMQRKILEVFADPPSLASGISPKELAGLIDSPLATVSYHVRMLAGLSSGGQKSPYADKPLLREVDAKQRRGAIQHFYALTEEATV